MSFRGVDNMKDCTENKTEETLVINGCEVHIKYSSTENPGAIDSVRNSLLHNGISACVPQKFDGDSKV